jgi:hypothetical protein
MTMMYYTAPGFLVRCTGFIWKTPYFGDPSLQVGTAGHCVFHHADPADPPALQFTDWYSNQFGAASVYIGAAPGTKGAGVPYYPYGQCTTFATGSLNGWTVDQNLEYDLGVHRIGCPNNNHPAKLGWTSASDNAAYFDTQPVWASLYNQGGTPEQQWFSGGNWYDNCLTCNSMARSNNLSLVAGASGAGVVWNSGSCSYCTLGVISGETPSWNYFAPYSSGRFFPLWNLNP